MEQFNQNMQAIDIHLTDEQMARLTKASDTPLPYPYNVIKMLMQRDNA
jgi:aryl-alcohol dehydrogenase-like predicted oxidoreductase